MASPLLTVKFFIPHPRTGLVNRPQLISRFSAGLELPLTLVSAPAGFGKSTLVSMVIHDQRSSSSLFDAISWLSLDAADNAPARFWLYFIAALQKGMPASRIQAVSEGPDGFDTLLELLQTDPPPTLAPVLDTLINEIARCDERILLVLDDYHVIQSPQVHEQMVYLLEHQPPNLHLILATRADPPLPLSRLRARRQLSEFRAPDLRFTQEEAAEFLRSMTGLGISQEDVSAIEASTEGWIAGLQMAALALQAYLTEAPDQAQKSISRFIASFSGKHVFILDYLAEEVFNHQPEPVQMFLLQNSVLERLCAGLCDAIMWDGGPDPGASGAQAMLEYLERSNLFIIPLDNQREWYRFHQLFADLLRARLQHTSTELIPTLHKRASHWYEQNGWIGEAVHHSLEAKDWDRAAHLLEQHIQTYLENGQLATVLTWIEALPKDLPRRRPKLSIHLAWALAHASQTNLVGPLLQDAEAGMDLWEKQTREGGSGPVIDLTQEDAVQIRGVIAILRSYIAILSREPARALALAQEALAEQREIANRETAWLNWVIGFAHRGLGNLEEAIYHFSEAVRIAREVRTVWEDFATDLAVVNRLGGKLTRSAEIFQDSLRLASGRGSRNQGNLSRVEAFLSGILLEQNLLDQALAHAEKAVEYTRWWPSHNHIATAYSHLASVLLETSDLDGADHAIRQADLERRKAPVTPFVHSYVDTTLVRVWLARREWTSVEQWAGEMVTNFRSSRTDCDQIDEYQEMRLITLVRVWLEKARLGGDPDLLDEGLGLIACLEKAARAGGRVNSTIEIGALQAVMLHLKARSRRLAGTPPEALKLLESSLKLAEPESYIRMFSTLGQPMAEMLAALRRLQPAGCSRQYLDRLLAATIGAETIAEGKPGADMVEPLTERELEVLHLLAQGLSNREMAQRLFVSEGTIKSHVHNLISKLEAQSRTHAIVRAKELNLL